MKKALLLSLSLLLTVQLHAIQTGPVKGDRIGILQTPGRLSVGAPTAVSHSLPRYLREELERSGYRSRIVDMTADDLRRFEESRTEDFYLEVAYSDEGGGPVAGIGVGNGGVGAQVSVVTAAVSAEIRVYSGRTMELLESFVLQHSQTAPAITGLGIGDPHGYFFLSIPFFASQPYRTAAREVARQAAERLSGVSGE